MRNEPIEFARHTRRRPARLRKPRAGSAATPFQAHVVDAAFADLGAITLRLDEPVSRAAARDGQVAQRAVVQQLASQLSTLDEHRSHLAQLLHELQAALPVDA